MKLTHQNIPFTMVANEVLARPDISLKAKGLFAYLFSKPDGWDFAADRIAKECKEERKSILGTLKELETANLLKRIRRGDGTVDYRIEYTRNETEENAPRLFNITPHKSQSTKGGLRYRAETGLISNKEEESNKENIASRVIDAFKEVNPVYKKWFANTTQRNACERMAETHGVDRVLNAVAFLKISNASMYMPTITTPLALEEKWAALEAGARKQRSGFMSKKIITV